MTLLDIHNTDKNNIWLEKHFIVTIQTSQNTAYSAYLQKDWQPFNEHGMSGGTQRCTRFRIIVSRPVANAIDSINLFRGRILLINI